MSDHYAPSDIHVGGQRLSTSMLSTWGRCPREFWLSYLCPHPNGPTEAAGFQDEEGDDAIFGKAVHFALQTYRLSGWVDGADTGEYNLRHAQEQGRLYLEPYEDAFKKKLLEDWQALLDLLLRKYHEERPGTLLDWRLLGDPTTGAPLTEHEYAVPILGGRYLYTVKADAIVERTYPDPMVGPIDYKTKSYRYIGDFSRAAPLLGQGWGEASVVHYHFPHLPISRMQFECLVKDRSETSREKKPFVEVVPVQVDGRQASRWLQFVEREALKITWHVAEWRSRLDKGEDPWEAGLDVFSPTGQLQESGTCARYGRTCLGHAFCQEGNPSALLSLTSRSLLEEQS